MNNYLQEQFDLTGKRAVVTGAGRGIGRAIAEALAGAGAEVCVHYHSSAEAAQEVVTGIKARGSKAWSARADLTKSNEAANLFEQVKQRWGALDILVNNTGDLIARSKIADLTDELIEQVLRVNIHSAVYSSRAAIPLLAEGNGPCIINLSSIAAHNGGAGGAVFYATTKGALLTYTRGLAKELAPTIRVNGIAPGVALTDFHRDKTTEEQLAIFTKNTPLQRLGAAEDHGAAAVFLCSHGASYITGEVIEINGGLWVA